MKSSLLLAVATLLLTAFFASAQDLAATGKAEADKLAKVFPSLYWYASDACLRETSRHGPQTLKYRKFVADQRVEIQQSQVTEINGQRAFLCRMKLYDPNEPKEYWVFEFTYREGKWATKTAYKYFGQTRAFDLYNGDIFMGSMKPYIQKGLDAFSQGKDFTALFYPVEKESLPPTAATPAATPNRFPFTPEKAAAIRGPVQPRLQVGDIVEPYRHFGEDSFLPGPSDDVAGTKWKVKAIKKYEVELELIEGRYKWTEKTYKEVGFVARRMSSIHYGDAFKSPSLDWNQQFMDEFRKVQP